MALKRCTRHVDGTIPVPALLYNDEELLSSQDGVGIYDGSQKAPNHQNGGIHVTSHRLFYIDAQHQYRNSFALDLALVTQTDHYAGLFTSSPKVTLHLSGGISTDDREDSGAELTHFDAWECEVCAHRNPPGLSPAASRICGLCGVPRAVVPQPASAPSSHRLAASLPSTPPRSASSKSHTRAPSSNPCPACTFLNHISLRYCEICSTEIPRVRQSGRKTDMKSAPASRPTSPNAFDDPSAPSFIKISFRKGGDKAFYAILKRSLKGKAWAASTITQPMPAADPTSAVGMSGISGIMRSVEDSALQRQNGMSDALQDLEALMVKAKDMVRLAGELNERLTASTAKASSMPNASSHVPVEPEEATFIRSSLSQLGLQMVNVPLTQDMVRDERRWTEDLAVELARVLQGSSDKDRGGLMKDRPVIALDEVWGGWNRARGVALIPPSTLLQVLPYLPNCTSPIIQKRTFSSGLSVLHTPSYSHLTFCDRLCERLKEGGPRTTMEVAAAESITIGLTGEMIGAAEVDGYVCRDDGDAAIVGGGSGSGSGAEVRWWVNMFSDYVWDGQEVEG